MLKFIKGDKVIPLKKSVGNISFEKCAQRKAAIDAKRSYLYIVAVNHLTNTYRCSFLPTDDIGNEYAPDDLIPYVEESTEPIVAANTKTVLQEAQDLIYGDREKDYGKTSDNFADIAKGWSIITKSNITPEQAALMMIWLKVCRANNDNCGKRDSYVDIAGYAGCIEKIKLDI